MVTVTDLDFVTYDTEANELAVFQLKWQQPVGIDASHRLRRSTGRNLVTDSNKWIETVFGWIGKYGLAELAKRLGLRVRPDLRVQCFVMARYNAHFSGFANTDERATWIDWSHFLKAWVECPGFPPTELAAALKK
ncbi:hypothetical protein NB311A_13781 [Nitrobacter sp. Nb-311A]|uniref:hypothetical protein n=1 Tax=Nitrobacter sp. Nb-311A TaxID=314253 RepID=UPI0000687159|nr:hypothetical protein [Nitrobacter sp. Nb-311A]EAQ34328.1 hypothetical protein NB311A_13781 [Nitrobacter sp. Nb-311A]